MPEWAETLIWMVTVLVIVSETVANARKSEKIKYMQREIDRLEGKPRTVPPQRATKDDVR